jgi:CubicO group peptidase (beta-lactamase class C family)
MAEATTNLKPFDPVALQGTVEATAKELLLPGTMVLLRTPQGEFTFDYGATVLGGAIPPRADTHFRIASNTKTMTAAVIVQLGQEGKLRFDDAISKYVKGVPNGDNITISELLKMRSGLYNYTSAPSRKALIMIQPGFGRRRNCSRSRSSVQPSSRRARNTIIATPIISCSGSSPKSLKARPWQKFFRIVYSGR